MVSDLFPLISLKILLTGLHELGETTRGGDLFYTILEGFLG